jgi:hypothetical protein
MNIYLKLFLAAGIPFGIFMGIFYSLQYGFPSGLVAGLFVGILFGVFMSLILGFLHSWSVKRMPSGKSEEAMGVHHVRNVELRLPYDKVFNLCVESLRLITKCKIQKEDHSQGKIVAKAGMTWKTWGDIISFEVRKIDNDRTQVMVSSRPAVRTTLVDYGKNLENVERISAFLKEQSETAYNSG